MSREVFEVGPAHRGERLDRFLQARVPRMSRAAVQQALAEGRVELASGLEAKAARRLVVGERVVLRPREPLGPLPPAPRVLRRGAGWVVVDKPAGMRATPTARDPGRDVASLTGLAAAHRLDRFTSGALLLAATPEAARWFEAAFREGRILKAYAAVVRGRPADRAWTCRASIGPAAGSRVPGKVEACDDEAPLAQPAETLFERAGTCETPDGPWTLVRARPLTGRRHQVRVHAAASGHPIVGDLLHGGDEREFVRLQLGHVVDVPAGLVPGRHLLHARALAFSTPEGARELVEAPWPADLPLALVESWGTLPPWPT
jgi:23S rRNA-/tRNA-specific pseudouridylate synthase